MKKIIIPLMLILALLAACANNAADKAGDNAGTSAPTDNMTGNKITLYDEGGLSFDIPEAWQQNFKAVTREAGSSGNTYPQTEFYYTNGDQDIRLMTIGKYTREQWENLKKTGENVADAMLGESPDKNHVYSIFYENHDYITDNTLKETLAKLKTEAESLRDKIMIK